MADLSAPPLQDQIAESPRNLVITKVWHEWLLSLVQRVQTAPESVRTGVITLSGQTASIGLTSLVASAAGVYRVSYRFRVTTPDGVSSSLRFTVTTTEGTIVCTQSGAAYTGNVTNAPQSGMFIVHCDPATPLQFSTTYASNTPGAMVYEIDIRAESL